MSHYVLHTSYMDAVMFATNCCYFLTNSPDRFVCVCVLLLIISLSAYKRISTSSNLFSDQVSWNDPSKYPPIIIVTHVTFISFFFFSVFLCSVSISFNFIFWCLLKRFYSFSKFLFNLFIMNYILLSWTEWSRLILQFPMNHGFLPHMSIFALFLNWSSTFTY